MVVGHFYYYKDKITGPSIVQPYHDSYTAEMADNNGVHTMYNTVW